MARNPALRRLGSEAGAILVQAAVGLIGLVACTAFVVDYGMQLVSRNQAQNAADAGALAGAGALAIGGGCAIGDTNTAKEAALNVARTNFVWGKPPFVTLTDVTTPTCRDGRPNCIRVTLYRDAAHGNPLPTTFGQLSGVAAAGVAASATAEWLPSHLTDCLRPWAVPDQWTDKSGAWTPDKTFDKYSTSGKQKGQPLPNPDIYIAPSSTSAGTGVTVGTFCGMQVTLKRADITQTIRPWQYVPLVLERRDTVISPGGDTYYKNVTSCNAVQSSVGESLPLPTVDVKESIEDGVQDLIAKDAGATWDPVLKKVAGGCMAAGTCVVSPRLVAVALFDPDMYETDRMKNGGVKNVTLRNFVGLFISQLNGSDVVGYLTLYPGLGHADPKVGTDAAFLKTAVLVR